MTRILKDGSEVPDYEKAFDLTIHTKCPEKWILIDMETGQKYVGTTNETPHKKWLRLEE